MDKTLCTVTPISRRLFLASSVIALMSSSSVNALTISQAMPWNSSSSLPPLKVLPGPWQFFTWQEALVVEAMAERLIPADARGVSGKDAGCAVFIDRQLAGSYGSAAGAYMDAPFSQGTASQGFQGDANPARRYREGLTALAAYVDNTFPGKTFNQLLPSEQDDLLGGLETNKILFMGTDASGFFELVLQNIMEGFFSDPVYGGNRDMAGWRLLGFPGARYDYRDWIERHNEPYPLPPTSIMGRSDWSAK